MKLLFTDCVLSQYQLTMQCIQMIVYSSLSKDYNRRYFNIMQQMNTRNRTRYMDGMPNLTDIIIIHITNLNVAFYIKTHNHYKTDTYSSSNPASFERFFPDISLYNSCSSITYILNISSNHNFNYISNFHKTV